MRDKEIIFKTLVILNLVQQNLNLLLIVFPSTGEKWNCNDKPREFKTFHIEKRDAYLVVLLQSALVVLRSMC